MEGLFFTGTDTSVGKTVVTAGVARLLRAQGTGVRVAKPVATGAAWRDGRWVSEDTLQLAEAAGLAGDLENITPWAFPCPVAPPVAARRLGVQLSLTELEEAVRRQVQPGSMLLVEGVGGFLCPLTERETVADLVSALGLPLVVVARRSLGTLNHTLLTVEAARARQLRVAGVVICETTPPTTLAEATNVEELQKRLAVPLLAVVPFQTGPFTAFLQSLVAVDWRRLGQT